MKTINTLLISFGMLALMNSNASAQTEESVFTNGKEVFLHKDNELNLKSFLKRSVKGKVYLSWIVSNLKNDGTFLIYRSCDGENFEIIGIQQTLKNGSKKSIGYAFIDNAPIQSGPSYYKIMHLDTNNAFFISDKITNRSSAANF